MGLFQKMNLQISNEMKSEARDQAPTGAAWASDPRLSIIAPNVARTP